ncbi:hypothetical protein ABZW47_31550 [Streptomyces sp. NPDC004549]|uniref:DNA polymerase Y family protein n=1 Tax=Streptomyces sp. NPDC004549 TaxID=3154283 RepID=UPI0033AB178E
MTTPAVTGAPRPRSVLRVVFHTADHPAPGDTFDRLTDLVEDITPIHQGDPANAIVDLDITGALRLFKRSAHHVAAILQLRAIALHGVPTAIGGGRSPMIAAMAAAITPLGCITVIDSADQAVARFLNPRPVAALPGIGPATAKTLARYGIQSIGDLAAVPHPTLARLFGTHAARELSARAHGIDPRPVQREALVRSTAARHDFDADDLDPDHHRAALLGLADELGARLRAHDEVCGALALTIRYADRTHTTRTRRLPERTAHSPHLATLAHQLYGQLGLQRARVRQITLRADHLAPADQAHQQLLLGTADDDARRLEAISDAARARFGDHVITRAALARRAHR